jgi:hypothetical protein
MRAEITLGARLSSYSLKYTGANDAQILGTLNPMTTIAKTTYVRSPKLLQRARLIPCQICGSENGTVVAAHSNQSKHGKGMGRKASDNFIASLCWDCHYMIDQGQELTKIEKKNAWDSAHLNTVWALIHHDLWPPEVPYPETYEAWKRESTN